jgi:hypothetical protein
LNPGPPEYNAGVLTLGRDDTWKASVAFACTD